MTSGATVARPAAGKASPMTPPACPHCKTALTSYDERCALCGEVIEPPPNVRRAADASAKLEGAYADTVSVVAPARLAELEEYSELNGRVVVNMSFTTLRHLLEHPAATYGNFWEDFQNDKVANRGADATAMRMKVDAELFAHHCKQIRCGLLSFDGQGASFYAPFAATLRGVAIHHRVSLLEDNPFHVPFDDIRNLHRATWDTRTRLVAVRFGKAVDARPSDPIAAVVAVVGSTRLGQTFVEAHIWGKFGSTAIEAIVAQVPKGGPDHYLAADIARIRELSGRAGIGFSTEADRS